MRPTHKMKNNFSALLVVLLMSLHGCSGKNSGINIRLPENQRLEDTAAGWWIKELGLDYGAKSKYITKQIHDHLIVKARLLDKYREDDDALTALWEYYSKEKRIVIKEKIYKNSDGVIIWINFEYPPPGVPWRDVIPADYMRLEPNRKYEHAVTVHSAADRGARLFLFGWGDYCRSISAF